MPECSAESLVKCGGLVMECDDRELVRAIQQDRDPGAVQELYHRHGPRMYNLAYRILANSALAQDAVQEALLAIWLSTKPLSPEANVGNHLLRTVSGKSLNLKRNLRRSKKREERVAMEAVRTQTGAADLLEGRELLAALRSQIDALPEMESQLLAFCFGARMSHREIGEQVGLPQQRVTEKINQALEQLRANLARIGVAAAVPLVDAKHLGEVFTSGQDCPPELLEKVVRCIGDAGSQAGASLSRRATAVPFSGRFLAWGAAVAVAAGLAAYVAVTANRAPADLEEKAPAAANERPEKSQAVLSPPGPAAPFKKSWSFESEPPPVEMRFSGEWAWVQSRYTNLKALVPRGENEWAHVELPCIPPHLPLSIKVGARGVKSNLVSGIAVHWVDRTGLLPGKVWEPTQTPTHFNIKNTVPMSICLWERWVVVECNNQFKNMREFASPYPGTALVVSVRNFALTSIAVESVSMDEFPFDARVMLEGLEKEKREKESKVVSFERAPLEFKPFKPAP